MSRLPRTKSFLLALVLVGTGCANSGSTGSWGDDLTDKERAEIAAALPAEAVSQLLPLSEIFYGRITSRRFNSRATFEDPSVRQFFTDVASYSDYYAALVDALDRANIRYNRPTRVELLGVEVSETGNLMLDLRFVGRNDLPLRWWSTYLARKDEWRLQDGRWFLVPGKV